MKIFNKEKELKAPEFGMMLLTMMSVAIMTVSSLTYATTDQISKT